MWMRRGEPARPSASKRGNGDHGFLRVPTGQPWFSGSTVDGPHHGDNVVSMETPKPLPRLISYFQRPGHAVPGGYPWLAFTTGIRRCDG
jgi:hypothetical protein